jgi:hypothetical protein
MNYWIFVHTGINADKTFLQLTELKNWGFETKPLIKNRINELRKGDVVVFYVGGRNGKYLSGEARLTSNAHTPTRESVGGPKNVKVDSMIDFDNMDLWNGQKIHVSNPCIRQKLGFIKNKDNWGMTFGQSLVKITESAYKDIKALLD